MKKSSSKNNSIGRRIVRIPAIFFFEILFLVLIISYALVQFTQPTNLKMFLSESLSSVGGQIYNEALQACQQIGSQSTFSINFENQTIAVNCSDINQGENVFVASIVDNVFNKVYYQNYTCEFFKCLQGQFPQNVLVIFSAYGNAFFNKLFFYSLFASIALAVVIFVTYENFARRFFGFGKIFLLDGISFLIFAFFLSINNFYSSLLPQSAASVVHEAATWLSSEAQFISAVVIFVGIVFYLAGFVLQRKQNKK